MLLSNRLAERVVALVSVSDDTIDMVQSLLTEAGRARTLVWCHFADLRRGRVDFAKYLAKHDPEVVIFDISPPYDENLQFFETMRHAVAMRGRRSILTTPNKRRLDEASGADSHALEVVGTLEDLQQLRAALAREAEMANLPN
jgi:hypothetical protein